MRRYIPVAAMMLVFLFGSGASGQRFDIYGMGVHTCNDWNKAAASYVPGDRDAFKQWAYGFVSGVNLLQAVNQRPMSPTNAEAIIASVDQTCRTKPAVQVSIALQDTAVQLMGR